MTFYHTSAANPYRASTGSMPLRVPTSPNRSKYEETCESCGSSYTDEHLLPINTPFSSSGSLQPPSHHHHRPRRASNSAHEPPQILTRYPNGAIILEPATSYPTHGGERRRRPSVSAPPSPPSHSSVPRSEAHRSWASYYKEISITEGNAARPGTTRFPRKLVNKDAVKQMGLPFEEERGGAIVVLRVLPRPEIERLVELTESIRANRHHSHRPEKHVRIITQPTDTIEHPEDRNHHHHRRSYVTSSTSHSSQPQVHFAGSPRSSSHRLQRAEEEAAAAAARARDRAYRAEVSGGWLDGVRATKAVIEAEEKARIAEDIARKEGSRARREVIITRG